MFYVEFFNGLTLNVTRSFKTMKLQSWEQRREGTDHQ
jgi:hypothetical protein